MLKHIVPLQICYLWFEGGILKKRKLLYIEVYKNQDFNIDHET